MDEYGTNLKEYMLLSHNIHVISYNIYIYTYYYMILCSWNIQLFFPCWPPHFRPRSPWDRLTGSMVGTQPSGGRGVRRPGDALISMAFPWVSTGFLRDFYGISMGFLWASMGHGSLMRFINTVSKYSWIVLWFHSDNWRLFMEMNGI